MPRALKVFRTAIGFHDAYVAAPSQKAALAAWGTDKNLFARGAAEIVTDPALTKIPLAQPGKVIQVVRGSTAEHLGALGKTVRPKAKASERPRAKPGRVKPQRPPKPSREAVRLAEQALQAAEQRAGQRLARLALREKALDAERRRLERALSAEQERYAAQLRTAKQAYQAALATWSKSQVGP